MLLLFFDIYKIQITSKAPIPRRVLEKIHATSCNAAKMITKLKKGHFFSNTFLTSNLLAYTFSKLAGLTVQPLAYSAYNFEVIH